MHSNPCFGQSTVYLLSHITLSWPVQMLLIMFPPYTLYGGLPSSPQVSLPGILFHLRGYSPIQFLGCLFATLGYLFIHMLFFSVLQVWRAESVQNLSFVLELYTFFMVNNTCFRFVIENVGNHYFNYCDVSSRK